MMLHAILALLNLAQDRKYLETPFRYFEQE